MNQYIAPHILRVNGQPAPCACTDTTVCAYCVQANLILWEREQENKEEQKKTALREAINYGQRRLAQNLGLPYKTVNSWIKRGSVPSRYVDTVINTIMGRDYPTQTP